MKKIIRIMAITSLLMFITGCGSKTNTQTLTCTKTSTDEDGYKTTDTIEVTAKEDKVIKVIDTNVSEVDPNYLDFTFNLSSGLSETINKLDGMNVVYTKEDNNKIKFVMTVDFAKLNTESIKDAFGDLYDENNFYSEKDITLEKFKENNLKDYTCK